MALIGDGRQHAGTNPLPSRVKRILTELDSKAHQVAGLVDAQERPELLGRKDSWCGIGRRGTG